LELRIGGSPMAHQGRCGGGVGAGRAVPGGARRIAVTRMGRGRIPLPAPS
jgi:hypothetical protein